MRILMMTNTFTPHVGGVARSVEAFTGEYRRMGHEVLVVAPEFEGMRENEKGVVRVAAISNFNGSDFSVRIPFHGSLSSDLESFKPDIVHSHHPFMLGDTAVRAAHKCQVPLVFTHHTMYEQYTHYVPADSPAMRRFAIRLSVGYCNLCDHVIAPSESVAKLLRERGVERAITVLPTGVDVDRFARGSGPGFRAALDLPADAFIVGHLGRLAPEKNLLFLAEAMALFLRGEPRAHCLVVGRGPSENEIREVFERERVADRLHLLGILQGSLLISAYRAMDVFAFASQSETQGMVLTEAMAAGTPVVAVDAPGVREVVRDAVNGRLLERENLPDFAEALRWVAGLEPRQTRKLEEAALATASEFSMRRCAERAIDLYRSLLEKGILDREAHEHAWTSVVDLIKTEWDLLANVAEAAGSAIAEGIVGAEYPDH